MFSQALCTVVPAGYHPASQRKPPRLNPSSRVLQVLETVRWLKLFEHNLATNFSTSVLKAWKSRELLILLLNIKIVKHHLGDYFWYISVQLRRWLQHFVKTGSFIPVFQQFGKYWKMRQFWRQQLKFTELENFEDDIEDDVFRTEVEPLLQF